MAVVYENFLKDNDITDPTLGYIHDLYAKLWNCVISIGPVYKPIYKHNISNTTDFKVEAKEQEENILVGTMKKSDYDAQFQPKSEAKEQTPDLDCGIYEPDINTPFFGNSGAKIPMREVKSAEEKLRMRQQASNIFELTKGFTGETTDNAMKAALEMAAYVMILTNDI